MQKDRHQGAHIVFRCAPDIKDSIMKIATDQKKTQSEVLRQLVEAGLVATGYKQEEGYLEKLVGEAVTSSMKPHIERLASISAKAAQISGAAFFMNVYMGQLMVPSSEKQMVMDAAADARKLGIEYLKLTKDRDIDAFISEGVEKVTGE